MRQMIAGLPGQFAWALDAVPDAPACEADDVLVVGMGGSGISGDVARAVVGERRIEVVRSYRLPEWAKDARPVVVAVSYSGATEETRSALAEAQSLGLTTLTLTSSGPIGGESGHLTVPGGLQPRAAFGYLSAGLLRLLHAAGLVPDQRPGIEEAVDVVGMLLGSDLDGPATSLSDDLTSALMGRIPFVYGSPGITGVAAYRWKTQVNENAKLPAVSGLIPELDHNELAGWRGSDQERRIGIVHLRDRDEHPQVARRFTETADLTPTPMVGEVFSQGTHRLARLLSLTTVGDLVSLFLAERDGVDPVEVDVLIELKRRLKEPS